MPEALLGECISSRAIAFYRRPLPQSKDRIMTLQPWRVVGAERDGRRPSGRTSIHFFRTFPLLALLTAACAYDPPVAGDHQAPAYKADLTACRAEAEKNAYHAVISRGPLFMVYPISYPLKKRSELRKCMVSKGHPLQEG